MIRTNKMETAQKFEQMMFQYILEAKLYIQPTNTSYFLSSVSHSTDIWRDRHEKKLGGWLLGVKDVAVE